MQAIQKVKDTLSEVKLYWNQPRPGEYVPYKEIAKLSVGWMALYMSIQWSIGFGVGNQFTGMTLGMTNTQLLVMMYICQIIGYVMTPVNAWLTCSAKAVHVFVFYTTKPYKRTNLFTGFIYYAA